MILVPIADQDFGEPVDLLHHAFELTYSEPSTEMPTNVRGSVPQPLSPGAGHPPVLRSMAVAVNEWAESSLMSMAAG
jgi:hypothetical protein